jgi:hypothetical protein
VCMHRPEVTVVGVLVHEAGFVYIKEILSS